jgi:hypothetical protein
MNTLHDDDKLYLCFLEIVNGYYQNITLSMKFEFQFLKSKRFNMTTQNYLKSKAYISLTSFQLFTYSSFDSALNTCYIAWYEDQ